MRVNPKPEALAAEIKEVALKSGADLVGIVPASVYDAFPNIWVGWTIQGYTKKTTDIMSDAKSIVVIGHHLWDDMLELAIKKDKRWFYPGYLPLEVSGLSVIHDLRDRGYKAVFCYSVSIKRLAQLAGFGRYGKNALIISPVFGPWLRLTAVLTNTEIVADKPFEQDLCGDCEDCIKACPVSALTPYKVDDTKCLVGVHLTDEKKPKYRKEITLYEPSLTENSHLMCMECQKACKYGIEKR